MFDIGFLELIIVAVLALLVLGPERLPKAAHTVGKWVGRARRMVNNFSREIDRQVEIEELKEELKKQGQSLNINDDANQIHRTVSEALSQAADPEPSASPRQHESHSTDITHDTNAPSESRDANLKS